MVKLLVIAAPLSVAATLLLARNVWLTFAVYHLGICLLAPYAIHLARGGGPLRAHLADIGLLLPPGQRLGGGVAAGLLCGLAMGGAVYAFFHLGGDALLRRADPAATLAGWGAGPSRLPLLTALMLPGNALAEELFWRGWVHRRLERRPRRPAAIAGAAAIYTLYHTVTLASLTRDAAATAALSAAVFAAGCAWGWLRERHGHVWPALLGHSGATIAYMAVLWEMLPPGAS